MRPKNLAFIIMMISYQALFVIWYFGIFFLNSINSGSDVILWSTLFGTPLIMFLMYKWGLYNINMVVDYLTCSLSVSASRSGTACSRNSKEPGHRSST